MQVGNSLLVEATQRVDQCLGEHLSRTHLQGGRLTGVGESNRAAQGRDSRFAGTGRDGGGPGLDDGLDRGIGHRVLPLVAALPHRRLHGDTRLDTQLALEQVAPGGVLLLRGRVVARQSVEPDEQGLVVLVERAHRSRAYGEPAGPVERTARHQAECGLVEDRLGGGREPPALGEQPGLEGRGPADLQPVEQLGVQPDHLDACGPGVVGEHVDIDGRPRGQPEHHRIAVERDLVAEAAPDLRQAPAERSQWVVGLGEEQPGQLAPRRVALGEQQVGQQGPALAAAEPVALTAGPLDAGATQESDRDTTLGHVVSVARGSPGGQARPITSGRARRSGPQECSETL